MKRNETVKRNEALDPLWQTVPRCDRYFIDGKRYVIVWKNGRGRLIPLAEYADV